MEIRKVGILGGGKMSGEIFKIVSAQDYEVTVWVHPSEAGPELDKRFLGKLQRRAKRSGDAGEAARKKLEQVKITTDLNAMTDADLIIEAVIEKLSIKREMFGKLDKIIGPECILVTNTSSLSPTSMTTEISRKDYFAGLHFFYPATLLSFVEVIPVSSTRQEVTDALVAFVKSLGKRPLLIGAETSGFLINRSLIGYYNEGARLVGEGHWTPDQIDTIARRFAMMGPCESMDQVSIELLMHGLKDSDESWSQKDHVQVVERAQRPWPEVYYRMADDGRLGSRFGVGFHRYEGGKAIPDPDYFQKACPDLKEYHKYPAYDEKSVEKRLWYSIVLEAAILEEWGSGNREDLDYALKEVLGLERGPFAFIEHIGLEKAREELRDLETKYGPAFAPRGYLKD